MLTRLARSGQQLKPYPKAAFDEEDEAAREGRTLAENCQDVLAGHVAGIHHQLHSSSPVSESTALLDNTHALKNSAAICSTVAFFLHDSMNCVLIVHSISQVSTCPAPCHTAFLTAFCSTVECCFMVPYGMQTWNNAT